METKIGQLNCDLQKFIIFLKIRIKNIVQKYLFIILTF